MAPVSVYERLGVAPDASDDDLRAAYRRCARELHPDLHPDVPDATRRFQDLAAAYARVAGPQRRAEYDRELAAEPAERARVWPGRRAAPPDVPLPALHVLVRAGSCCSRRRIVLPEAAAPVRRSGRWWHLETGSEPMHEVRLRVIPEAMESATEHARLVFESGERRYALALTATRVAAGTPR